MTAKFYDQERLNNPMNATYIKGGEDVEHLFSVLQDRPPFLFELVSDQGFKLLVGYAGDRATVQFSRSDGMPPYLMALGSAEDEGTYVTFLSGGTPTPISERFCLPIEQVKTIVGDFLVHGGTSASVEWEEI